jgi:hypothetical protein
LFFRLSSTETYKILIRAIKTAIPCEFERRRHHKLHRVFGFH